MKKQDTLGNQVNYAYLALGSNLGKKIQNLELAKFSETLEKVCIRTVEKGFMTKDLALLVGPQQSWLTTQEFIDEVDKNLQKKMS